MVILLIGLATSLVSFTGGSNDSGYKLREELRFFANTMSLIAEEASLAGEQRGVDFFLEYIDGEEVYGYRWLKREDELWYPYVPLDFDEERLFSSGFQLFLEMEGEQLEIGEKQAAPEPPVEDEASVLESGVVSDSIVDSELLAREPLEPDVWLFSSGEVTPFTLSLVNREASEEFQLIEVDMLGRISLDTDEEE